MRIVIACLLLIGSLSWQPAIIPTPPEEELVRKGRLLYVIE